MEEVFFTSKDGTKIAANIYRNDKESVIIIVHGWFMSKNSKPFLELAETLSKDFDVISIDCRGHGNSSGDFTFTIKEQDDLSVIVNFAKKTYTKVFLLGFSLGGALVLLHCSKSNDVDAVVSVSPPAYFEKIENNFWHPRAFIPTLQKFELKTWFSVRADLKSLLFKPKPCYFEEIKSIKTPVMFIAGEKDPTVKCWHTKELFESVNCIKDLKLIPDGNHAEDLFLINKTDFVNLCKGWLFKFNNISQPVKY